MSCGERSEYPWQAEETDLPVVRLSGEIFFLIRNGSGSPPTQVVPEKASSGACQKKPKEKTPGEWKRSFDNLFICSYPPEDVVVEGYGKYLQKKAIQIKSEENNRVAPL